MKRKNFLLAILLTAGVLLIGCGAGGAKNGDIVQVHYSLMPTIVSPVRN